MDKELCASTKGLSLMTVLLSIHLASPMNGPSIMTWPNYIGGHVFFFDPSMGETDHPNHHSDSLKLISIKWGFVTRSILY